MWAILCLIVGIYGLVPMPEEPIMIVLSILCIAIFVLIIFATIKIRIDERRTELFKFDKETQTIVSYIADGRKKVVIPKYNNGIEVKDIGVCAFYSKDLTNIKIPNSIKEIGGGAFYNNNLTNIKIPYSVKDIGESAFYDNNLANIEIPSDVMIIDRRTFSYNNLTNIEIPNGVIMIGDRAFRNNKLTSIQIPDSVRVIGESAFANNKLISIEIPDGIMFIGEYAFANNRIADAEELEGGLDEIAETLSYFLPSQSSGIYISDESFKYNQIKEIIIHSSDVNISDNLLTDNNNFKEAYLIGGAGRYTGTQDGTWKKIE